jgi:hypothetical protein
MRELAVTLALDTMTVPFFSVAVPGVKVELLEGYCICESKTSVPEASGNVYVLFAVTGASILHTYPVAEGNIKLLFPSKENGGFLNGFIWGVD